MDGPSVSSGAAEYTYGHSPDHLSSISLAAQQLANESPAKQDFPAYPDTLQGHLCIMHLSTFKCLTFPALALQLPKSNRLRKLQTAEVK
jgi:hypothetical protein